MAAKTPERSREAGKPVPEDAGTSPYGDAWTGPLGPRRSPVDLYAELLEALRRSGAPRRITRLSYSVGMPVDRTRRALDHLRRIGLVEVVPGESVAWRLTRRGWEFLEAYWKMRSFLEPVEGFVQGP